MCTHLGNGPMSPSGAYKILGMVKLPHGMGQIQLRVLTEPREWIPVKQDVEVIDLSKERMIRMAKKIYTIEYGPDFWSCTVSIDFDSDAPALIKALIVKLKKEEAFPGAKIDDYVYIYLQMFSCEVLQRMKKFFLTPENVKTSFDNSPVWFPANGSMGIELLSAEEFDIVPGNFTVYQSKS